MAGSPAERARSRHLAEMQLALRDHLSLAEARMQLAEARWRARDQQRHARCGTEATREDTPNEGQFWWQRGDMA